MGSKGGETNNGTTSGLSTRHHVPDSAVQLDMGDLTEDVHASTMHHHRTICWCAAGAFARESELLSVDGPACEARLHPAPWRSQRQAILRRDGQGRRFAELHR